MNQLPEQMAQSNEFTIEQMNEVIAGFSEIKSFNDSRYGFLYVSPVDGKTSFSLRYHCSWDWLMPVGRKIRDLLQEMMKQRPPHTACNGDLIEVDISCAISEYNIEKAHEHMFQFITWYNQQKQNNATTK